MESTEGIRPSVFPGSVGLGVVGKVLQVVSLSSPSSLWLWLLEESPRAERSKVESV